jgi:hypothetical protein
LFQVRNGLAQALVIGQALIEQLAGVHHGSVIAAAK